MRKSIIFALFALFALVLASSPVRAQQELCYRVPGTPFPSCQTVALSSPYPVTGVIPDGGDVAIGSKSDAAWTGTGSGSVIAILKGIWNAIVAAPTLGSASGGETTVVKTAIINSAQTIKASAGQLFSAVCDNNNAAWTYVVFFDATSATFGTISYVLPLPPSTGAGISKNLVGLQFSNSIKVAAVTSPLGSTAPSTSINCGISYN